MSCCCGNSAVRGGHVQSIFKAKQKKTALQDHYCFHCEKKGYEVDHDDYLRKK